LNLCILADASSIHAQKWVRYFAEKGHETHLISVESCDLPNATLHQLTPLKRAPRAVVLADLMFQIRKLLKSIEPDVLHAHYASSYGFWGALSRFRPFVFTAWGSDILIDPTRSRFRTWKLQHVLGRADLVTCDAQHVIDRMVQLGCQKQKIRLVCFGVDTERFSPDAKDETLKSELGWSSDFLVVISTRSLEPVYDVGSLIRAAPLVLSKVPHARFLVVGNGKQRDDLADLAQTFDVTDAVKFLGSVPNSRLPRYLASADVYVSAALSDAGIAASTAEAMSSGLPVVVTDVADNRSWVRDGEGGFLVPPKAPEALAERITYLLQDQAIRRSFGAVNRKTVQERNEYWMQMELMERLYRELLEVP
jgi:glycosyltransferase involved in cell wall biosynthesis